MYLISNRYYITVNFLLFSSILIILISVPIVYAEEYIIDIPFGAYNPELNTPAEVWYDPPQIFVTVGDTITWYNDDRESHTVTSGDSPGRFGWMDNKEFGKPEEYLIVAGSYQVNHGHMTLKNQVLFLIFV